MDTALSPPVRIQPQSVTLVSKKHTEKRLDAFLNDFQTRTMSAPAQGGNTAVTVQLQKLKDALHEERYRERKKV